MSIYRRISNLFSRSKIEREIDAELQSHIEMRIEDNVAAGMSPEAARRDARLKFGNPVAMKENVARVDAALALDGMVRDVRYAVRQLRNSPGFATVALLTLALGIGANTGIFTLLDAVLFKSLPVPNPEQLFLVKQTDHTAEKSRFSYPFFERLRQQLPQTTAMAAMSWPDDFYTNAGNEQPEHAVGQLVSGNYFQVFGTYPVLGRLLTSEDDAKLSGSATAVISYGYWKRRFAGDPAVVGRKLEVNHVPVTIVGVAARGFFGARSGTEPDFWMPLAMQSDVRYHDHYSDWAGADPSKPWVPQEHINWLQFVVRVKDPAALPRLRTVLNQQYRHDLALLNSYLRDSAQRRNLLQVRLTLEPGQRGFATLRKDFARPLLLLMGMAAIVLLIACANIANLLLARAASRQRAFAVRLSMGASRARLIRQTLIESLLLSTCGGVLGIAVAFWCTRVLPKWASAHATAIPLNLAPDGRILCFSLLVAIVTGILFGLAPALESAHVDPASVLKASAASISGHQSRWSLRKLLVAAQVALSLVLLVGAGMFLRTLENYSRLDPGFDREHLLSVHIDTHLVNYANSDFSPLYQRLIDQMEAIPGVRSASVTTCPLVSGCVDSSDVILANENHRNTQQVNAQVNSASLNYFATVGIRLLRGRAFATTDDASAPKVAIVNQTFVLRYLGSGSAIGRRFSYPDNSSDSYEIVGLVTDARINDIREAAPPLIYFPIAQDPGDIDGLDIRTVADPQWIAARARQAVATVDHRIPIVDVVTLSEEVKDNLTEQRLVVRLTSIFGLLALGLACLGLYGVMSYTVQRRTSEIGMRLALGAPRSGVLWLVLRETLVVISAGALIGVGLSVAAMRLATSFVFGLSPQDPITIAAAAAVLYLVASAAGFLPALRAASIEPMQALRSE